MNTREYLRWELKYLGFKSKQTYQMQIKVHNPNTSHSTRYLSLTDSQYRKINAILTGRKIK